MTSPECGFARHAEHSREGIAGSGAGGELLSFFELVGEFQLTKWVNGGNRLPIGGHGRDAAIGSGRSSVKDVVRGCHEKRPCRGWQAPARP